MAEEAAVQSWWDSVWGLKEEDIAAGKVITMFDAAALRGADKRLSHLYVRRMYAPLYSEILSLSRSGDRDWLCHLNGNAGVGKSAFLWYFLVRTVILLKDPAMLHIIYESSGFICEFKGRQVRVAERSSFPLQTFSNASIHLINQKVPETGAIGPVVLLAASPARENVKAAKADRKLTVVYMYPWEKDEFDDLVKVWARHGERLQEELESTRKSLACLQDASEEFEFDADKLNCASLRLQSDLSRLSELRGKDSRDLEKSEAQELAFSLQALILCLEAQVEDVDQRVKAAPGFYEWFGGLVRLLWSADRSSLTCEAYLQQVDVSLKKTNLSQLLSSVLADDIPWPLLHFVKPPRSSSFRDYNLNFCSRRVQDEFTLTLTRLKAEELELFMNSAAAIGLYGALRGYVFEELSIAHVLRGATLSLVPLADDKHCAKCKSRGEGASKWVACDACEKWYHFTCALVHKKVDSVRWVCNPCNGKPIESTVSLPRRLLRYYEGDLKVALQDAGAEAINYVWRPVMKNNGAVDFTILPSTLIQPTVARKHSVAAEALGTHIDALRAWNNVHRPGKLHQYLLCFCLTESNYEEFGFQSYRDKSRRVTRQALKGIRQCKVLLRHDTPLAAVEEMEVPGDVDMVDDFSECTFDGQVVESSYFDPDDKDIVPRIEEMALNKKRRLAYCPQL